MNSSNEQYPPPTDPNQNPWGPRDDDETMPPQHQNPMQGYGTQANQAVPPTQPPPQSTGSWEAAQAGDPNAYGEPDQFTADQFRATTFGNMDQQPGPGQDPYATQQNPGYAPPTQSNPQYQADPYMQQPYGEPTQQHGYQNLTQQVPQQDPGIYQTGAYSVQGYATEQNPQIEHNPFQPAEGYAPTQVHQPYNQTMQQQGYATGTTGAVPSSVVNRQAKKKPTPLPAVAVFGGAALLALVAGVAIYFLFLREDAETVTPIDEPISETTVSETPVDPPVDSTVVAAPASAASIIVAADNCPTGTVEACEVSGPLDASLEAPYQVVANISEGQSLEVRLNGSTLENPTAPFGLDGASGKQTIEVLIDGQLVQSIAQFGFVNQVDSFGAILSYHPRNSMDTVLADYDSLVGSHPDAIVTEGAYLTDSSSDEQQLVAIYVGGFETEDAVAQYCTDKGLAGDACRITRIS